MSNLTDALAALETAVGARLPSCSRFTGYRLSVPTPGFVVGWPTLVTFNAGPAGRALYDVPITLAVELGADTLLGDFLAGDGLADQLAGSTAEPGWWGALEVLGGELRGLVPNGAGDAVVADITVRFYA